MRTPRALYAACQDRVEGAGASGECASDADCARAGCASEVCVAAKQAPEVMTGCDVLDCFSVLDSCGCHDGLCTWTLKLPAPGPTPLPAR
jgi:eight-cysteine-cluster-containing protein